MGARLRVFLKEEKERTLKEMRQAENLGKRERDRAAAICLSHHGWYVEKIAAYLRIGVETVRRTLNKDQGFNNLSKSSLLWLCRIVPLRQDIIENNWHVLFEDLSCFLPSLVDLP